VSLPTRLLVLVGLVSTILAPSPVGAESAPRAVDVPTRPGVVQRFLLLTPDDPKAAVVLFAGGQGGLQIAPDGALGWGKGNFLVRSRDLFLAKGLMVAVIDAPSDRQSAPYLAGFRQRREHASDVKEVIAWLRRQAAVPVWLVGTSRGTQSAAYIATELPPDRGGPNGIVLTSSILRDDHGRAVPEMPLDRVAVPVLVVHHKQDGCGLCAFVDVPRLMTRLTAARSKELLVFDGGVNEDDPCDAFAYHGFNGLEREVVSKIAEWILAR
jgi:dienelactone hydrolase